MSKQVTMISNDVGTTYTIEDMRRFDRALEREERTLACSLVLTLLDGNVTRNSLTRVLHTAYDTPCEDRYLQVAFRKGSEMEDIKLCMVSEASKKSTSKRGDWEYTKLIKLSRLMEYLRFGIGNLKFNYVASKLGTYGVLHTHAHRLPYGELSPVKLNHTYGLNEVFWLTPQLIQLMRVMERVGGHLYATTSLIKLIKLEEK